MGRGSKGQFERGHQKVPGSGMRKGQVKHTTALRRDLIEEFESSGFALAKEIVAALTSSDYKRVEALMSVAPYVYAKLAPKSPDGAAQNAGTVFAQFLHAGILASAEQRAEGDE